MSILDYVATGLRWLMWLITMVLVVGWFRTLAPHELEVSPFYHEGHRYLLMEQKTARHSTSTIIHDPACPGLHRNVITN